MACGYPRLNSFSCRPFVWLIRFLSSVCFILSSMENNLNDEYCRQYGILYYSHFNVIKIIIFTVYCKRCWVHGPQIAEWFWEWNPRQKRTGVFYSPWRWNPFSIGNNLGRGENTLYAFLFLRKMNRQRIIPHMSLWYLFIFFSSHFHLSLTQSISWSNITSYKNVITHLLQNCIIQIFYIYK